MTEKNFSVFWWDREGGQHRELYLAPIGQVTRAVKRLTTGPAAMIGFVDRVIITDGGDMTCFEWWYGKGITFPPPGDGEPAGATSEEKA